MLQADHYSTSRDVTNHLVNGQLLGTVPRPPYSTLTNIHKMYSVQGQGHKVHCNR